MTLPPIYVLRHGETEWNRDGRHQGRLDSPLTEKGRAQAAAQGDILAALDLRASTDFLTSPQGRSFETASIIAARLGWEPVRNDDLMEVGFGQWEGLTANEIEAGYPGAFDRETDPFFWHFSAPGGEDMASFFQRIDRVLGGLKRPTILSTHGITSRGLRGRALGVRDDDFWGLPGGQGIVHAVIDGTHLTYDAP